MDRRWLEDFKQRISILDYLKQSDWEPCCRSRGGQVAGLCPLHPETKPSFWVHPERNVFYCHGCGRGGDVIRLVELWRHMSFTEALAHLRAVGGYEDVVGDTAKFYAAQLSRFPQAMEYLEHRGIRDRDTIADLRIGYAPGACLRGHLHRLGYQVEQMRAAGVINASGRDSWYRRIVFPCGNNLYGRSLDGNGSHRFLVGTKGGLYRWNELQSRSNIILVEGMFDLAALWQCGFRDVTCGWGAQLNAIQYDQLASSRCTVWITFDGDLAGQRAARELCERLRADGGEALRVTIPSGHDPASYFAEGATSTDFHDLLAEARP